jgi:lipid II:glycine glycyltransferase (peptidoglycan interpeptide bridge formation enzyme)
MNIELLRSEDEPAYETFVEQTPASKIYHTLAWRQVIAESYGYQPYYIVAKEDAAIIGALPLFEVSSLIFGKRLVSIPFSHWVNILYNDDLEILTNLLDFAQKLAGERNSLYVEVKHGYALPPLPDWPASAHFFDSVLDLRRSLAEIWDGFESGSARWGINRAKKSNLRIEVGRTLADYQKFHRLELETRKSQGAPSYPFCFFKNLREQLGLQHKLYLAYLDEVCIAGIIVFGHHQRAIYGYSASRKKKEYLQTQPTNLLLWTAIQELHHEGYQEFDFGTTPPHNQGLLQFKSRWGTKDDKIPYYYFLNKVERIPVVDRTSGKIRLVNHILQRLPVTVLDWLGPLLLKQVG